VKRGIVVLSLFDGMSCGMIALERAGVKVKKYYASELDKYAQIVSAANYPEIVRLGDITKWKEWKIEKPDLIIGGSPCQGFSFAGKGLNFNDPRSKLFFTFVDILKYYKPKYFLLENVKMKKEFQAVISDKMGCAPIEINSALVSAQNRKRLYWTNIPNVTQPKDQGIFLKDIIETEGTGAVKSHGKVKEQPEKSQCLDANYHKGIDNHGQRTGIIPKKSFPLLKEYQAKNGPGAVKRYLEKSMHQMILENAAWRKLTPLECERLQTVPDNYTNHVSNSQRYKMLSNGWTVDVIAHIFKGLK